MNNSGGHTAVATRLWTPRRVLVTAAAWDSAHGREIVRRCEAAGVADLEVLTGNRLPSLRGRDERETYRLAKSTLAVVTAPPSKRQPQPIPPSADWRFDLAEGCPAHCQYCYLAGSLAGPPVTRVYANLEEILAALPPLIGAGRVTSLTDARRREGTTYEASCYTDPLGLEHLTGSLAAAISFFGHRPEMGLRFTTKYAAVEGLLGLAHGGRTRMRASVNAAFVTERFEGGTARVPARLAALARMAEAGYPVGLTIAPVMPGPQWQREYAALLDDARTALAGVPDLDLTVELITHRFTSSSREVQLAWYPRTRLDLDPAGRTVKRTKFGGEKFVYPREVMRELREFFDAEVPVRLPGARQLYWT